MLSGFLLHRPIASALLRGAPLPGVRAYARNRALRVLPAYWVALLLTAFALQTALIPGEGVGLLDDPAALLTSLFLVQGFSPETVTAGIGPARHSLWRRASTSCCRCWGCSPRGRSRGVGRAGVCRPRSCRPRSCSSWGSPKAAWALADDDLGRWAMPVAQTCRSTPTSSPTAWRRRSSGSSSPTGGWRSGPPHIGQLLAGAVLLAAGAALAGGHQGVHGGSPEDGVLGLAFALLVLSVALPGSSRLTRALEWRWVVGAGLISYGVYLWHTPLIFLFSRWGMDAAGVLELALAGVVVAAATVAVSTLSYRLVERPALRYKRESAVAPATPGVPGGLGCRGARRRAGELLVDLVPAADHPPWAPRKPSRRSRWASSSRRRSAGSVARRRSSATASSSPAQAPVGPSTSRLGRMSDATTGASSAIASRTEIGVVSHAVQCT